MGLHVDMTAHFSRVTGIKSPVVDDERTMLSHWFTSVLCVFFSFLTLLVAWQEHHLAHEKSCAINRQKFSSGTTGGRKPTGTGWPKFTWKWPLNEGSMVLFLLHTSQHPWTVKLCICMFVLRRQRSSLLWTPALRPYSGPVHLPRGRNW